MTTGQIIILSILGIVMSIGYFGTAFNMNYNKLESMIYIFIFSVLGFLFLILFIIATIENNNLRKQLKNKCPEYEQVNNVYKLKDTP